MIKQLLEFPEFPDGKSARQRIYEEIYVNVGLDINAFWQDVYQKTIADAALQHPNFKPRAYMATSAFWNMSGLIKEYFPDCWREDEQKRIYLALTPNVRLYLKKLDEKRRPSNIRTKHVKALNCSQGVLFGQDITVLYAGYQLLEPKSWEGGIACFLLEMKNNKALNWCSSLDDLSDMMYNGGTAKPVMPIQPKSPSKTGITWSGDAAEEKTVNE